MLISVIRCCVCFVEVELKAIINEDKIKQMFARKMEHQKSKKRINHHGKRKQNMMMMITLLRQTKNKIYIIHINNFPELK